MINTVIKFLAAKVYGSMIECELNQAYVRVVIVSTDSDFNHRGDCPETKTENYDQRLAPNKS